MSSAACGGGSSWNARLSADEPVNIYSKKEPGLGYRPGMYLYPARRPDSQIVG